MANTWGTTPIILDTANADGSYDADNDAKNGGVKYSTLRYKLNKIEVVGAVNGNDVVLTQCEKDTITGNALLTLKLETGDLNKTVYFNGQWVQGIIPVTLDGACVVRVWRM